MRTNKAPTNYPSVFLSANQIWWLVEKSNFPISESQVRVKVKVMSKEKVGEKSSIKMTPGEFRTMEIARNIRCELVSARDISFLEGKLKTLIESLGLSDKQEKASKDIVQVMLWDWFTFITDHTLDHLGDKKKWYTKNKKLVK